MAFGPPSHRKDAGRPRRVRRPEGPLDRSGSARNDGARPLVTSLGWLVPAAHPLDTDVHPNEGPASIRKKLQTRYGAVVGQSVGEPRENARAAWARAKVLVWPERYVLATFPLDRLPEVAALVASSHGGFAALVVERDEVSLTLSEGPWRAGRVDGRSAGPYRVVTLDVDLDLDLCGFLAPLATRLAEAGVPILPQCAFRKDHILVRDEDLDRTVRVLQDWIRSCARAVGLPSSDD